MKRHLVSVDTAIDKVIYAELNTYFARDVIAGAVVHNVETDEFVVREKATPEFLAEAEAAYARSLADKDESR